MMIHRTFFAAMIFTLAACATGTSPEQAAEREAELAEQNFANDVRRGDELKRVCFPGTISGFGETTRTAVVVSRGTRQYLLTTRGSCFELEHAERLGVQSFGGGCLTRGDRIFASDDFSGSVSNAARFPCYVDKIYKWDRRADDNETSATDEEAAELEEVAETADTET